MAIQAQNLVQEKCAQQESELDSLCKIRRIQESIAQTMKEAEHLHI